ncbi:MAG: hypothetical protein ACT452_12100 [Microthrixaceae bacterium]
MPARRPNTPALDALTGGEHANVLTELLDAHPDLRPEADQAARRLLEAVTVERVAGDVARVLESIPLEDLANRSGRIRGRGYVHESEAAWELVSEAVDPFMIDLRRRAGLGLMAAAAVVATGVVAGLYQAREPEDGTVVAYARPDALSELADEVVNESARLAVALPPEAADHYWPEWSELS